MKITLIALAGIATLFLVIELAEPTSVAVPRWSLFLVLAISLAGMAYYRRCFEQVVRQRNEIQEQLVQMLPKYSERDGGQRVSLEGTTEMQAWAQPTPKRAGEGGASRSGDLTQPTDLAQGEIEET